MTVKIKNPISSMKGENINMLSKIILIIAILLVLIVWCILFGPVHVPFFEDVDNDLEITPEKDMYGTLEDESI